MHRLFVQIFGRHAPPGEVIECDLPFARAGEIEGTLLLIWGTRDPHTPAAGRDTVRRGLDAAGTGYTWSEYDAEHAFGRDVGERYDPGATDAAFAETVAAFRAGLA